MSETFEFLFHDLRASVQHCKEATDAVQINTFLVACFFSNMDKMLTHLHFDGWIAEAPSDSKPSTLREVIFVRNDSRVRYIWLHNLCLENRLMAWRQLQVPILKLAGFEKENLDLSKC